MTSSPEVEFLKVQKVEQKRPVSPSPGKGRIVVGTPVVKIFLLFPVFLTSHDGGSVRPKPLIAHITPTPQIEHGRLSPGLTPRSQQSSVLGKILPSLSISPDKKQITVNIQE